MKIRIGAFRGGPRVAAGAAIAIALTSMPSVSSQSLPGQFVIEGAESTVRDIVERYGLQVVEEADDSSPTGLVLVSGSLSPQDLIDVRQRVAGVEANSAVRVTEASERAALGNSTATILETLPDRTPVAYYGSYAWKGYIEQAAAKVVRAKEAQNRYGTGNAIVAIIDTGVDGRHPLLEGRVIDGYDFTRNSGGQASDMADLTNSTATILEGGGGEGSHLRSVLLGGSVAAILEDDNSTATILEGDEDLPAAFGHGTMVAGLVHLVAPTAEIMPLKAFGADGQSNIFDIVRAVYYATDHGARVINMSFTMGANSESLKKAIKYATDRGVICVSAAGNESTSAIVFPASYSMTTGVASTSDADVRSRFSNFGGADVSLAAPGERLITTYPGGHYAAVWGTSFSSGLVSGSAAILLQSVPGLRQGDFENAVAQGAYKVSQDVGHGRLDIYKTLQKKLGR